MSMEKPDQASLERRAHRIGALRKRLTRVEQLERLRELPEWRPLRELLQEQLEHHERALNAIKLDGLELDDSAFRRALALERTHVDDFRWILDLVHAPREQAADLKANIESLERELEEARSLVA